MPLAAAPRKVDVGDAAHIPDAHQEEGFTVHLGRRNFEDGVYLVVPIRRC